MPGAHFEIAPHQQEKREHSNGFKIDIPSPGDGGPGAGTIGQPDGQCHRYIHDQLPGLETAPGGLKKRRRRKPDHRRGHQETEPAQKQFPLVNGAGVHAHRHHARLHHAEPGHSQAQQGLAVFLLRQGTMRLVGSRSGAVADARQFGHQLAERLLVGVPG